MGGPTRARKVERCDAPVVADVVWRGGCGRGGGQVEGKGGQLSAQNPSEASCAASSVGRGAAAWHDGTSRPQQSRAARGCGAEQSARGMRGARTLRVRRARAEGPRPLRVVDRAAQRTTALRRATSEADSARPRRLAGAPPDPSPPPFPSLPLALHYCALRASHPPSSSSPTRRPRPRLARPPRPLRRRRRRTPSPAPPAHSRAKETVKPYPFLAAPKGPTLVSRSSRLSRVRRAAPISARATPRREPRKNVKSRRRRARPPRKVGRGRFRTRASPLFSFFFAARAFLRRRRVKAALGRARAARAHVPSARQKHAEGAESHASQATE